MDAPGRSGEGGKLQYLKFRDTGASSLHGTGPYSAPKSCCSYPGEAGDPTSVALAGEEHVNELWVGCGSTRVPEELPTRVRIAEGRRIPRNRSKGDGSACVRAATAVPRLAWTGARWNDGKTHQPEKGEDESNRSCVLALGTSSEEFGAHWDLQVPAARASVTGERRMEARTVSARSGGRMGGEDVLRANPERQGVYRGTDHSSEPRMEGAPRADRVGRDVHPRLETQRPSDCYTVGRSRSDPMSGSPGIDVTEMQTLSNGVHTVQPSLSTPLVKARVAGVEAVALCDTGACVSSYRSLRYPTKGKHHILISTNKATQKKISTTN